MPFLLTGLSDQSLLQTHCLPRAGGGTVLGEGDVLLTPAKVEFKSGAGHSLGVLCVTYRDSP